MSIHKETFKGYTIRIEPDDDPESPREWDNLGTIAHWHRRYDLGERKAEDTEIGAFKRGGLPLLTRYLRRYCGATVVLPISLLDHSGLHIWVGSSSHWSDPGGWDSGVVGFIYDSPEGRDRCGTAPADIERVLQGEIEEFDQCLRGDVYGYIIETPDGEHVDSYWGFYGLDYCLSEAKEVAAGLKPIKRYAIHVGKGRTLTAQFGGLK